MRTSRIGKAVGVSAAAAMFAAMLSSTPAQAEPSPIPGTDQPSAPVLSDVERARESIDYLMANYKVSQAEALRRLQVQAKTPALVEKVRASVGDELLDFWMDQEKGGKLTFLTSKPALAATALGPASLDVSSATFVQSKYTAKQLETARAAVEKGLAGKADVRVLLDKHTESISVRYIGTDKNQGNQVRSLAGQSAGDGVPVVVDTSGPEAVGKPRACLLLMCDTPMRGGVRIHMRRDPGDPRGDWGSCTAGFNIRGSNGWAYVLTAGHCVELAGPRRTYGYHNGLPLVWEKAANGYSDSDPNAPANLDFYHNQHYNEFYDWAMMPYQTDGQNWSGYWLNNRGAHNLVASNCVSPSNNGCTGNNYGMRGVASWNGIGIGFVVCASGTGTGVIYSQNVGYQYGTHCGTVKHKDMYNYCYMCYGSPGRGIMVNICSRDGDSGGPLFSQLDNSAYGILSGSPDRSGACSLSSDDYSVYAPLEGVLADARFQTGITYSLITSATG